MGQTGSRNGAGSLREELGKVGQRRDGKVACDTDHAPAKDLQPHGVLVLADNGLLVAAEQHTAQGDRQDQTVESTGQDDHALRAAEDRHNKRGESDETDDEPLVVLGDEGVNGLEEGDGGVGRADDGGDTGGEQRETEETVADVAGSKAESLGCGVGSASDSRDIFSHNDRTGRADTEHAQEQQDTNAARDTDAGQDGLAEVLDFFRLAAPTRVKQLVCARKVMYPPQEPPSSVTMTGMSSLGFSG